MQRVNIAIIGGGVIGLSIAASLSTNYTDIYLLEKNKRMAQEISTHNSGVIHSGIHYPPGSLKAKLCVQGNKMIYNLCAENKNIVSVHPVLQYLMLAYRELPSPLEP